MTDHLFDRVRESNRQSADAWTRWTTHRDHVMAVLRQVPPGARRLCLLGAGHLHDVVMSELSSRYREMALVDVDDQTVTHAVSRTAPDASCVCHIAPSTDLTGVMDLLESIRTGGITADQLSEALARHECNVAGAPFDVTASLGLLTQLVQAVVGAGCPDDQLPRVVLALRNKHLRDLARLTSTGGTCVLVTDVVSSVTAPAILRTPETELATLMAELVAARNFFTGVNPYRIVAVLEDEPPFRDTVTGVRLSAPWLWDVTPDRQYLTCAIVFSRAFT
jgi:hypothetical protein